MADDPFAAFVDSGPEMPLSVQMHGAKPQKPADPWSGFVDEGPNSKPRHDVSTSRALLEGYLDTAGLGFRDEIKGLSEASGLPSWAGGFRFPAGAARLAAEKLETPTIKGDTPGVDPRQFRPTPGPVEQTYTQGRDEARAIQKEAQEQQPRTYLTGQLGGAIVAPSGMGAVAAPTVAARALRAAKVGAVQGGLSGIGSGEDAADRATRGALGAVVGGTVGAVASPATDLAVAGAAKVGQTGRSIYNALRADADPAFGTNLVANEAAKRITGTNIKDFTTQGPQWTPEAIAAANRTHIPLSIADTAGGGMLSLARSAADQSPEARAALNKVANERFAGQQTRARELIRDMTGGANATADLETIQQAARKANRGAYAQAYSDGVNGLWSPELERLAGDPALVAAAKQAAITGKTRAIADGFGAFNPGLTVTNDGRLVINNGRTGVPTYPDLQFWDYTYRNLRDAADRAFRSGSKGEGEALATNARTLRTELDRLVPSYKQARSGAAAAFGAEDALEAGRNFVSAKGENADYARDIAKFKGPERELFARGFASQLADQLLELRPGQNILSQAFLTSPASKQRIEMALGPDRARNFEAYMRAETLADRLREMLGGSQTSRNLAGMGLAGFGGLALGHAGIEGEWDTKHILGSALLFGSAYGKSRAQALDSRVAQRIGEMLASNDRDVFRRGVEVIGKNARLMDALRVASDKADELFTSKVVPRAVGGPAVNAFAPSAGDDRSQRQ